MTRELLDIRSAICTDTLDTTLKRLAEVALAAHCTAERSELDSLTSSYSYMKQYLLTGYNDDKRDTLYRELKLNAYDISSKMLEKTVSETNRSLAQAKDEAFKTRVAFEEIGRTLAVFAGQLATVSGEDNGSEKRKYLNERLFSFRRNVFNAVWSTLCLTPSDARALTELLLSDRTDPTDTRLIISALLLAQQTLFDIKRFAIFVEVCCSHPDTDIRQLALLAILLARPDATETELYGEEIDKAMRRMAEQPKMQRQLLETQLQMLHCADTKETQKTINDEILPVLKNSAANIGPVKEKSEDELLDELLHPDKEEKELEQVERSLDKIREMRKQGADIFFAGFSQAKRFSFFYTLMNWFVPFTIDHPQVASVNTGDISAEAIARLMDAQHFCDSDKYSFFLTFSRVVGQIPKQMLDILKRGEMSDATDDDVKVDTAFRRRLYLQDLYRFYTLYPSKQDFANPFTSEERLVFFAWKPINTIFPDSSHLLQVARQLLRRDCFASIDSILDGNFDELNVSYLKIKALSEERQHHYLAAMEWFRKALAFEPNNAVLMKKMAQTAAGIPDYNLAKQFYNAFAKMTTDADTEDAEYNYALCCIQTFDTQHAIDTLYKLYYLHDDNLAYRQDLAWALLQGGRYDDAMKIYSTMDPARLDVYAAARRALVLWMTHARRDAVDSLRMLAVRENMSARQLTDHLVRHNVSCNFNISAVDLSVITDLTFDNSL